MARDLKILSMPSHLLSGDGNGKPALLVLLLLLLGGGVPRPAFSVNGPFKSRPITHDIRHDEGPSLEVMILFSFSTGARSNILPSIRYIDTH